MRIKEAYIQKDPPAIIITQETLRTNPLHWHPIKHEIVGDADTMYDHLITNYDLGLKKSKELVEGYKLAVMGL